MKALEKKKGAAGFTLIEMAIVLVVIGLIIGAVLKGQDLISNARSKKFANFARQAEVAQWAYFDRNGRFANGTDVLGTITTFTNSTALGSSTFYVFVSRNSSKSCIVIGKSLPNVAPVPFAADDLIYASALDSAIDDQVSPNTKRIRALTGTWSSSTNGNASIRQATSPATWDTTVNGIVYIFD